MLTQSQLSALQAAASAAHGCELETGMPAALTVAQWALESGWGKDQPGNNCFGIKATDLQPGQMLQTKEVINGKEEVVSRRFRTFTTLQECFEARSHILTCGPSYVVAWRNYRLNKDFNAYLMAVSEKYATAEKDPDPNKRYSTELKRILAMPEVHNALEAAKAY